MNQYTDSNSEIREAMTAVAKQRYGMIRVVAGEIVEVRFRLCPRWVSWMEVIWWEHWRRRAAHKDECRLYYSQPRGHSHYLTLNYVASNSGTTFATARRALTALDQVALIKRSDALLGHITNRRISDRLLERWGWQQHLQNTRQRHWIKRFYGQYEAVDTNLSELLGVVAR